MPLIVIISIAKVTALLVKLVFRSHCQHSQYEGAVYQEIEKPCTLK